MRAPHLHDTLRRFCLGAFAVFHLAGDRIVCVEAIVALVRGSNDGI